MLPLWLPLESLELLSWAVFGGAAFGAIDAATWTVAGAPGNVPSLRLGDSDSPIGRENEGGRRSPPRDATAAAVAAARRACVPRAQSKFAKGFMEGGGSGGSEEDSTPAAAARTLPGNKQLEPTEASHACGKGVGWGAWEAWGGRGREI